MTRARDLADGWAPPIRCASEFAAAFPVSHETKVLLEKYDALLLKWAAKINLVARSTLEDRWRRHFLDSAQIIEFLSENTQILVDLGSGAGFPGLVLAILGAERGLHVHLIESDRKKCAFLQTVVRETGAPATIHAARAESLDPIRADVVTARALAPLKNLLELTAPFAAETTRCLFLKGRDVDVELTEAAKCWNIDAIRRPSRTDPAATILEVRSFARVISDPSGFAAAP
ncbi:MAG: 16S rRNA (guanine(527)-N(7))-methyltransferase RsmG [Parvularculaceae bacterium]